jgi:hypothetical protein
MQKQGNGTAGFFILSQSGERTPQLRRAAEGPGEV